MTVASAELSRHGIRVTRRIPHVIPPNRFNRAYLETKAAKSGHYLDLEAGRPDPRDLPAHHGF